MLKKTSIECLKGDEEYTHHSMSILDTPEKLIAFIVDFSNDDDLRQQAFFLYYQKKGDEIIEILKKLISIFSFSPNSVLKQFLLAIGKNNEFPLHLRLETIKDACICCESDDPLFHCLSELIKQIDHDTIPHVKHAEAIFTLMRNNHFKNQSLDFLSFFINDQNMSSEYRYKTILSIKTQFDLRKPWLCLEKRKELDELLGYYENVLFLQFFENETNENMFRILAAQKLDSKLVCTGLLKLASDKQAPYNTRADAMDLVLRIGTEDEKEKAKEILKALSFIDGRENTIYHNAQNAHVLEIEQSCMESLEKLAQFPLFKVNEKNVIDFDFVCHELDTHLDERARLTLKRIQYDNALYTKLKITLKSALLHIYSFIQSQEYKEVLIMRLCAELSEGADICSTGILERMINTFTGIIENIGIRISFEDEIIANVAGRLNRKAQNLYMQPCFHQGHCFCYISFCNYAKAFIEKLPVTNEKKCNACAICLQEEQLKQHQQTQFLKLSDIKCTHQCDKNALCNEAFIENVLQQMIIPTKEHHKRQVFQFFFRQVFPDIFNELYEEYRQLLDSTTFDLYMRKAVLHYIGEN